MELNEVGQILLPLTGVTRGQIVKHGVMIKEVGLKDKVLPIFNRNKYVLYIKYLTNESFSNRIKDTCYFLNEYEIEDYTVTVLQCLPQYKEDWKLILKGKYSKVRKGTVNTVISIYLRENKENWLKVFRRSREDVEDYVKVRLLDTVDRARRIKIAEDTAKDILENNIEMELYKPLKRDQYVINAN